MEENKKVKNAKGKVDDFMSEKENRILVELMEKWQLDYDSSMYEAEQKGLQNGLKEGLQNGWKKGKSEGIRENKILTAKKMIEIGLDVNDIQKVINLSKDEILKLKD